MAICPIIGDWATMDVSASTDASTGADSIERALTEAAVLVAMLKHREAMLAEFQSDPDSVPPGIRDETLAMFDQTIDAVQGRLKKPAGCERAPPPFDPDRDLPYHHTASMDSANAEMVKSFPGGAAALQKISNRVERCPGTTKTPKGLPELPRS